MLPNESEKNATTENGSVEKVCDLNYLDEMMGHKNHLILGIMDVFLTQIPEELNGINEAVDNTNYSSIKSYAHTMKSSVSIMGVSVLTPILKQMEELGTAGNNIEKIKELNQQLNKICKQAVAEIENEKHNYI